MFVFTDLGRTVVIFFLVFFLVGFVHGSPLMYMIAIFCLAAICCAAFISWHGLRGLDVRRELPGTSPFSGDPLETKIRLIETTPHWRQLEIFDQHTNLISDFTTHRRMSVLIETARSGYSTVAGSRQPVRRLEGGERVTDIHDIMRFPQRGEYRLGPLTVYSYDPFGLIYLKQVFPAAQQLIVYPHPYPLPDIDISGAGGRQMHEMRPVGHVGEAADFHSIRPYTHGDDLRRIHWKSTAHTGKLAVKEFEYHSSGAVQVILDLQAHSHFGGQDFSSLEASVTVVASLMNYILSTGNQAGLFCTGDRVVHLPPESGQRQLHRALETLALARDDGPTPVARAIASRENSRSGRCTTIVVTPSVDSSLIGPLLSLRGQAAQVLLVLMNPRSFYDAEQNHLKSGRSLWGLASQPLNIKKSLQVFTSSRLHIPTEDEHQALRQSAIAAGIEVFPVGADIPIHQALQGIRSRIR